MFMLTFSLSWVLVLGLAAAAAWLDHWLTDTDQQVLGRPVHGRTRATLH